MKLQIKMPKVSTLYIRDRGDKLQENSGACQFSEISGSFMIWEICWDMPFKVKNQVFESCPSYHWKLVTRCTSFKFGDLYIAFKCVAPIFPFFFFFQTINLKDSQLCAEMAHKVVQETQQAVLPVVPVGFI